MKAKITRAIAILLLLCAFPLALFSCSDTNVQETNDTQGQESETPTETVKETDAEGTLTLFKNGAYVAKIIRGEFATENEKTAYNRVKAAFKSKTGKSLTTTTDFVAAGAELDNSSAILVGETEYEESKNVYESLEKGSAIAKIVNNKYVVAFSDSDSLVKLLNSLT